MLSPSTIAAIAASRGSGAVNLLTPDPKEVWADSAKGAVDIDIDLGAVRSIDTVFLGSIANAVAGTNWRMSGGAASYTAEVIFVDTPLRAPDAAGQSPPISHGLWTGSTQNVRYLRITLTQPVGNSGLIIGNFMTGLSFVATYGHEWGAGRKVIDTGSSTPLPSGGFAVVEGARKGSYSWTFGDLTSAEVETLYALQLDRGETRPLLVVEDPAQTAGLRNRIHYGKLVSLRQFERRNPAQSRWEMTAEEWI
jgi:hypothetical protein